MQKTKFDEEHIYKKFNLTGFLRSINQRIVPLDGAELEKLRKKLDEILNSGALKARKVARTVLNRVREKTGYLPQ